ncbi:MAG: ABC transporter substrate-binding protein [Anaeromyxobacteraceae bacterium]
MIAWTVVLALAAAAGDGGPIAIGSCFPLSGGSAALGAALGNGAHLAAEEINAAGGVLGRKLALVDADDEARPEKGVQAVKDLLDREHVVALVGPGNTGVANALATLANERHVPLVVPSATGNKVNELFAEAPANYVFRLAASDAVQSSMMVTEAFAARGRSKAAILADDSPYGAQGRARVEALIAKRGLAPAYVGTFKVGDRDMIPQVTAAKAAGADVILLYALGAEAAAVARSLEKIGWRAEVIGTWNLSNPAFLEGAGLFGDGAVTPQTFVEAGASEPAQEQFVAGYRKRYGVAHVAMAPAAAQAYDAVHLLALAIAQARSTDAAKVKAALENLEATYEGATGSYFAPWRPDDHEAVTPANVVWGKVKGGAIVLDAR